MGEVTLVPRGGMFCPWGTYDDSRNILFLAIRKVLEVVSHLSVPSG